MVADYDDDFDAGQFGGDHRDVRRRDDDDGCCATQNYLVLMVH